VSIDRDVKYLHLFLLHISFIFFFACSPDPRDLHSFPTRRSSDLVLFVRTDDAGVRLGMHRKLNAPLLSEPLRPSGGGVEHPGHRSEEHTSELQSQSNLVCRLLLEKKN